MSETAKQTVVEILSIVSTLPELQAVRVLGYAEGMAAANAARDKPDGNGRT